MKAGITGLPYSGKTTLFCALTGQNYNKFSHSKDIHVGIIPVPDERLDRLFEVFQPKKKTYATMEYFDIAGSSVGSDRAMEPQVLQTLRNADSLIVVLDAFDESADPETDVLTVVQDFALNDLIIATGRLERVEKELHSGKSGQLFTEQAVLETCRDILERGDMLIGHDFHPEEEKLIRGFQFLTLKPLLIVVNISEADLTSGMAKDYEKRFEALGYSACAAFCAEIEMEIAALDPEDRPEFMESMGIREPALGRLIRMSYEHLGLISFFTVVGTEEVHAWTVHKGAKAPECAGIIHSDMERGFIRAETVSYNDLIQAGSLRDARDHGLLRIEGKDYPVQDGDILTIRFSV